MVCGVDRNSSPPDRNLVHSGSVSLLLFNWFYSVQQPDQIKNKLDNGKQCGVLKKVGEKLSDMRF